MDMEQARALIEEYVKQEFGRILELREISVARTSTGRLWNGQLYCVTTDGEVEVGRVGVTESGELISNCTVDQLVDAFSRIRPLSAAPAAPDSQLDDFEDEFGDFSLDSEEPEMAGLAIDEEEMDGFFSDFGNADLRQRIDALTGSGSREDLLEARQLMPRLLCDPDTRGQVLFQMGEMEMQIEETRLGLDYLEAAAREFADRADVNNLAKVAVLTEEAMGREAFAAHPVAHLVKQTRERLEPIHKIEEVPAFSGLGDEEMFELAGAGGKISIDAGVTLLKEGAEATQVFVIKSGVLSVNLETPDGGTRVVRCCFPGALVGESCVLDEPGSTCSATVNTESESTLWCFDGQRLRELADELPVLRSRIESTRELHRLDSFFSMNQATDTLDARVRDRLLGCISAVTYAQPGDLLGKREEMPGTVFLIAEGQVEFRVPNAEPRSFGPDAFIGLSDALHQLPLEGDYVVVEPCRLFCFEVEAVQKMAEDASPEVLAVFERIG
jgi:CRP-like cAMP-binding protein